MDITSLCTRDVVSIPSDASLHDAAALMCEQHVGALVVVTRADPPQVVGVLTDRDLTLEVLGRTDSEASTLQAGHLAKSPPVAVAAKASLQEAAAAMEQGGVRRVLVVDDSGGVIGVVAAEDVLAAIAEELSTLVRALHAGIDREKDERHVRTQHSTIRPVFPGYGTMAMQ